MKSFFAFLQQNPYLLLFLVVGVSVWIGRLNIKGYGLGMVAQPSWSVARFRSARRFTA